MDRQAFLEKRQKGIGSSDVAAILGLSPWKTALDVYLDKVTEVVSEPMAPALEWGIRLEPAIAAAVADTTGWKVSKQETLTHAERPYLIASIDRVNQFGEPIEIKSASRADGWGEAETADIPEQYWVQVQHQLEVIHSNYRESGPEVAWVFVLIGHHDFRRYRVPRDPTYLANFGDLLSDFWQCVEGGFPPEPDWSHATTIDAIQRLHRPIAGEVKQFGEDEDDLAREYDQATEQIKEANLRRDEAKARLLMALGSAEVGELPDGRMVTQKIIKRKAYEVKAGEYTRFEIKYPKGER